MLFAGTECSIAPCIPRDLGRKAPQDDELPPVPRQVKLKIDNRMNVLYVYKTLMCFWNLTTDGTIPYQGRTLPVSLTDVLHITCTPVVTEGTTPAENWRVVHIPAQPRLERAPGRSLEQAEGSSAADLPQRSHRATRQTSHTARATRTRHQLQ